MGRWLWAGHVAAFGCSALVCLAGANRARRRLDERTAPALAGFLVATGV